MNETTLMSDIHIYMSESDTVSRIKEKANDKADPIFIFAKITPETLEIGASTLRSGRHMPNFHTVLDRMMAGLDTIEACRAYQMGLVHGIRSQELAVLTGPMFDPVGNIAQGRRRPDGGTKLDCRRPDSDLKLDYRRPDSDLKLDYTSFQDELNMIYKQEELKNGK